MLLPLLQNNLLEGGEADPANPFGLVMGGESAQVGHAAIHQSRIRCSVFAVSAALIVSAVAGDPLSSAEYTFGTHQLHVHQSQCRSWIQQPFPIAPHFLVTPLWGQRDETVQQQGVIFTSKTHIPSAVVQPQPFRQILTVPQRDLTARTVEVYGHPPPTVVVESPPVGRTLVSGEQPRLDINYSFVKATDVTPYSVTPPTPVEPAYVGGGGGGGGGGEWYKETRKRPTVYDRLHQDIKEVVIDPKFIRDVYEELMASDEAAPALEKAVRVPKAASGANDWDAMARDEEQVRALMLQAKAEQLRREIAEDDADWEWF